MIPEPDVLEEVGQLQVSDLETLAVGDLAKLIDRVTEAKERARNYEHLLQSAMNHRFSQRAHQLRQEVGKTTGTVRFEEDGFVVIADLPKKPEYDQRKLKEAVEALRKWGENPEDYVRSRSRSPRRNTTRGLRRAAALRARPHAQDR